MENINEIAIKFSEWCAENYVKKYKTDKWHVKYENITITKTTKQLFDIYINRNN
jgi:hypothetical protein